MRRVLCPSILIFDRCKNRTSATNSAEIYNRTLAQPENQPADWGFTFDLRPEHIWEAFVHLAILEHYDREKMGLLVLPHGKEQKDRLKMVIQARNDWFASHGQPEWAHYCNKCVRWWYGEDGESPKGNVIQ